HPASGQPALHGASACRPCPARPPRPVHLGVSIAKPTGSWLAPEAHTCLRRLPISPPCLPENAAGLCLSSHPTTSSPRWLPPTELTVPVQDTPAGTACQRGEKFRRQPADTHRLPPY